MFTRPAYRHRSFLSTVLAAVYVVVGVFVANTHHYFGKLQDIKALGSAALAVVLWPLVLIGANFHLH